MPYDPSPFARARAFLQRTIFLQQQGDPTWTGRMPEMYGLIDQITDVEDGRRLGALVGQWLRHVSGERVALEAEMLLLQAQRPGERP